MGLGHSHRLWRLYTRAAQEVYRCQANVVGVAKVAAVPVVPRPEPEAGAGGCKGAVPIGAKAGSAREVLALSLLPPPHNTAGRMEAVPILCSPCRVYSLPAPLPSRAVPVLLELILDPLPAADPGC